MIKYTSEAMPMFSAVLIDIDDTVLDFQKCAKWAIKTAMTQRGINYTPQMYDIFKEVNDSMWSRLERGEMTREELLNSRFNIIFNRLGISADGREFEDGFIGLLHESTEEVTGARELLAYLYGRNYRIYAVSNAMQFQQENRLKKSGLAKYFSGICTSELLGAAKPSAGFFDAFFARFSDISKDEAVLIGDSLDADIIGGKNYGLTVCWFNNGGKNQSNGSLADYTVTSLSEIKNFM